MKMCFCQFSNKLINPPTGSTAEKFYDAFWENKRKDGYYKPEHFWEIPTWIAEICYTLPADVETHLHIIESESNPIPIGYDFYLFSVLDVTKDRVEQIIAAYPDAKFILGGYVDSADFEDAYPNAAWFDSVKDLAEYFGKYEYGTDYSLFEGMECVPRLTLSTGCKHRCKFCIVPNEVVEKSYDEICDQVWSFRKLDFKLVYVNDKTFGQANNYWRLQQAYDRIKQYNPVFEGFIVQTTAGMAMHMHPAVWKTHHVKVVELGMETFNNRLLRMYRKPTDTDTIKDAVKELNRCGVKVILNLLLGLPGENYTTYLNTYDFLSFAEWNNLIYSLNIYTLALYDESDLGQEVEHNQSDKDELAEDRTFWTEVERKQFQFWSERFYKLGIQIMEK